MGCDKNEYYIVFSGLGEKIKEKYVKKWPKVRFDFIST